MNKDTDQLSLREEISAASQWRGLMTVCGIVEFLGQDWYKLLIIAHEDWKYPVCDLTAWIWQCCLKAKQAKSRYYTHSLFSSTTTDQRNRHICLTAPVYRNWGGRWWSHGNGDFPKDSAPAQRNQCNQTQRAWAKPSTKVPRCSTAVVSVCCRALQNRCMAGAHDTAQWHYCYLLVRVVRVLQGLTLIANWACAEWTPGKYPDTEPH